MAQRLARSTHNRQVPGSNPGRATKERAQARHVAEPVLRLRPGGTRSRIISYTVWELQSVRVNGMRRCARRSARRREKPLALCVTVGYGACILCSDSPELAWKRHRRFLIVRNCARTCPPCPPSRSIDNFNQAASPCTFGRNPKRCMAAAGQATHLRSQGQKVHGPRPGIHTPLAETAEGARPQPGDPYTFARNPKRCTAVLRRGLIAIP